MHLKRKKILLKKSARVNNALLWFGLPLDKQFADLWHFYNLHFNRLSNLFWMNKHSNAFVQK